MDLLHDFLTRMGAKEPLYAGVKDSLCCCGAANPQPSAPVPHPSTPCALFVDAFGNLAIVAAVALGLMLLYRLCLPGSCRERLWDWADRWGLKLLFAAAWSFGFVVYCVGGYSKGFGILSVVFMSAIHATEMFVGASDISAVHEAQHANPFYMFTFGFSHFLAVLCSLLFIIRQIGFFFVSKFKAWGASWFGFWRQRTFVFWGINDASLLLAEDINRQSKKDGERFGTYRIIFVRTHDDAERDSEEFNPANLYDKVKMQRKEFKRLRALDCMVVSGAGRLSVLNVKGRTDVLRDALGLRSLCRIVRRKSGTTHVFLLGGDGDANVRAALNLTRDTTMGREDCKVCIYCHSRKSAETRSLEYYGLTHNSENTEVRIVDTSSLSVSWLKMNDSLHPVQHVSVNRDATVDSPFNAMIVGFGETGVEALRFLYEFGAFVGSDKQKSPFHCTVFDSHMTERLGLFRAQTPFLERCNEVTFCNAAINSPEYWEYILTHLIRTLNYIVVCPGNDKLALETASNLCAAAIKHRTKESPRKLTICVRAYDTENAARLRDFCADINEKYKVYGIDVRAFGLTDELFTYNLIVDDLLLQCAKQFNFNYSEDKNKQSKGIDAVWDESLGYSKDKAYFIDEIEEIERKRKQNFCNALHGATKLCILDRCATRRNISGEIRENIARLEHERWVACMHIIGWQRLEAPFPGDNGKLQTRHTTRKLHTDLCQWEEVRCWDPKDQLITQGYDYKVLDTTIELAEAQRLPHQQLTSTN